MPGARGDQKRALDLLEVALQMIVSHHVGAGYGSQLLCQSNKALNYWVITLVPHTLVLIYISKMISNNDLETEQPLIS